VEVMERRGAVRRGTALFERGPRRAEARNAEAMLQEGVRLERKRLRCHNQLSKTSLGTVLYRAPLDRRELRQLATEGVEGPVEVLEE
jgi:hypothetical protein